MQFWQLSQKLSTQSPITFRSQPKKSLEIYKFLKLFFSLKTFFWTRRMQFWQPRRKVIAQTPKTYCLTSEKNCSLFLNCFRNNTPLDTWNAILTELLKRYQSNFKTFPPKVRKNLSICNYDFVIMKTTWVNFYITVNRQPPACGNTFKRKMINIFLRLNLDRPKMSKRLIIKTQYGFQTSWYFKTVVLKFCVKTSTESSQLEGGFLVEK